MLLTTSARRPGYRFCLGFGFWLSCEAGGLVKSFVRVVESNRLCGWSSQNVYSEKGIGSYHVPGRVHGKAPTRQMHSGDAGK